MKFLNFGIKSSLLLLISALSLAEDVVYLNKAELAPFSGYLFSETKEKEIRIKLSEYDLTQELIKIKDSKILLYQENEVIYKNRVKELNEYNEQLAQKNVELQKSSDFMKVLYFLGGAVITTFIVFGMKHGP